MTAFLDLAGSFAEVEADARRRIDGVLARQLFVLGPETDELERRLGALLGARRAVAVSSGSEALSIALAAAGVGAGDAVLVPAFTFFASAGAVTRAGAVPVFVDIDGPSFLAGRKEFAAAIEREFEGEAGSRRHRRSGARLRALLAVHLFGRVAEMEPLLALAKAEGLALVEDAAQALGARSRGRAAGTFGLFGCFSFYPTKNLGGAGDGGLVATDDRAAGERAARLRSHGAAPGAYEHHEAGWNARLGELQAAVLCAKLDRLAAWTEARREVARTYSAALRGVAEGGSLRLPAEASEPDAHVWHQYAVRIGGGRRDRVRSLLAAREIETRIFYPLPLHLQPVYRGLGGRLGDLPEAEAACEEVLCLPIRPGLAGAEVEAVAAALAEALRESGT